MNSKSSQNYIPALDGIRGLAILAVIMYHNFGLGDQYYIGWLGVDLFFVLSGYLITNSLINTLGSKDYLRNFFIKRVLRIFPIYYLVLFVFLIFFPLLNFLNTEFNYYIQHQAWFWLYFQNWLLIFNFPKGNGYFNHFWSLAVEEQFYLIWPFIILWLKKERRLLIFLIFVLTGLIAVRSCLWLLQIDHFNYTLFYRFTRIDGICIGCIIAIVKKMRPGFLERNVAGVVTSLAILNFIFFFLNRHNQFEFPYLAFVGYTTFASMLGLLVNQATITEGKQLIKVLTIFPLRYIGKVSYGFYIFHLPVYLLLLPKLKSIIVPFSNRNFNEFAVSLICTLIAFCISVASYHIFETKFLRFKKRLNYN
jgi:peptidoglycan/LPS O-acetylase OafA/YrhL